MSIDVSTVIEALSLAVGSGLFILTLVLVFQSVEIDLFARSRLLRTLQAHSESFRRFRGLTDFDELRQSFRGPRILGRALLAFVSGSIALMMLLSLFDVIGVAVWLVAIGLVGLALVVLDILAYLVTRKQSRLDSLAEEANSEAPSRRSRLTETGYVVFSVQPRLTFLTLPGAFIGVFLGLLFSEFGTLSVAYSLSVALILLLMVLFWWGLVMPYAQSAEARLFTAWRKLNERDPVLVDPFYAGGGQVARDGQLWTIGDTCEVRSQDGRIYVMSWRKLDLLVAAPQKESVPVEVAVKPPEERPGASSSLSSPVSGVKSVPGPPGPATPK